MNTLQTHFWAVRDYLAPVLRESKFKEHGRITPEEFVAAGDFLAYKFPTWAWSAGEPSKAREYLPKDKQYLVSRGVPCLRRVSQMERAAVGGTEGGASGAQQDSGERMLSFAEGEEGDGKGDEEDWLATHLDGSHPSVTAEDIADIPDSEPPAEALTAGEEDDLAARVAGTNLAGGDATETADEADDIGDIPDMGDEDDMEALGAGVEEEDDPAARQPPAPASSHAAAGSNLVSVRTYDCLITYDKYYQTPRMWLFGYDESGVPLKPVQIFEDVSSDYAQKTVTIEPFPHAAGLSTASVHPCKHASVMRKVIERMDGTVREEQRKAKAAHAGVATDDLSADKKKKKGWAGLGGAVRKVTGKEAGATSGTSTPLTASEGQEMPDGETTEVEGLRVDQYLIIFLKFMASIVPAIEIDATQAV